MKVITSREMNRIDSSSPVEGRVLMERAGKGMAEFIFNSMPNYPVLFLCGRGNNGGDGIVAARYLKSWGRRVKVLLVSSEKLKGLPALQEKRYGEEIPFLTDLRELELTLAYPAITVDCILGTGFTPPLRQNLRDILEIVNKNSRITISCDIPTGVDASTGNADGGCLLSDATVTFEYPKMGHLLSPGDKYSGSIELVDIAAALEPREYSRDFELVCRRDCQDYFKKRSRDSHKKSVGHILIAAGSPGMEGAAAMTSSGALNSGAGLVTCALPGEVWDRAGFFNMSSMAYILDRDKDGAPAPGSAEKVIEFARRRKIDSAVIGPGLGTSPGAKSYIKKLIQNLRCPLVIDADGLNCIAENPGILKKRKGLKTLLTPHPGEMARLCGESTEEVLKNRQEKVVKLARSHSCAVLLKGYRTLISGGEKIFVNSTGGPGMAVGGSGDILSGIAGTLLARGMEPLEAAKIAAWVHGRCGDLAVWKKGERGAQPEDFLAELKRV